MIMENIYQITKLQILNACKSIDIKPKWLIWQSRWDMKIADTDNCDKKLFIAQLNSCTFIHQFSDIFVTYLNLTCGCRYVAE